MTHVHHDKTQAIGWALALNIVFTLVEAVGGLLTNSMAILANALHDLGDSFGLIVAYFLERKATQKPDTRFTYGYSRLSLLSALLNALVLITGSVLVLTKAVPRLFHPEHSDARGMIVLAVLGMTFNGYAAYKMRRGQTLNEGVLSWHLVEDALGWIAVLVIGVVSYFTEIRILDPLLSILLMVYVLWNVAGRLRQTVYLFLQGTPLDIDALQASLARIPGVLSVHDTHAWSQDGEHHVVSTHLGIQKDLPESKVIAIKCRARELIRQPEVHVTIEIEYEGETCTLPKT
jgi:cobalt-zinc-cadmium efflux system protein